MFKPNGAKAPVTAAVARPQTGAEWAMKAMGLGHAIEAAKQLVDAGAIDRILQFADQVGGINARLDRIERALAELLARDGADGRSGARGLASQSADNGAGGFRNPADEP